MLCPIPRDQPPGDKLVITLPTPVTASPMAVLDFDGKAIGNASVLASNPKAARIRFAAEAEAAEFFCDAIRSGEFALELVPTHSSAHLRLVAGASGGDFLARAREALVALRRA